MLLDNEYTIVPQIRFVLSYDNGIRKVITVKTRDTITCYYKRNGERFTITGVVAKIGCNFNSSLGRVGTTAYLQVDGSSEYSGQVEYIQPSQVLDLTVISTTDIVDNIVCSVDNEDQRISLVRENEVGVFQYSLDGITWKSANGAQGMSAYECAVALGFDGTEEEWLESLKGKKGDPGEPGALEIFKVFNSIREAEHNRDLVPKGKLVAVVQNPDTILFVRHGADNYGIPGCICGEEHPNLKAKGYDYLGFLTVGPKGNPGEPGKPGRNGKSAYDYAIEGGFPGTESEFMQVLGRCSVAVTNFYMGPKANLTETVIGPMDLRIFGYTNPTTFQSKEIRRIDVSSPSEPSDQTLLFRDPILLRAVPASSDASKPNVIIKGKKYVADCIMSQDGQVGVFRRIRYIDSYSGETILGDWMSSTGQLDMGAHVQFVSYGRFEPFEPAVQQQYRKLHTYDIETDISTDDPTYVSVAYPIDIKKFVENYVDAHVDEYIEKRVPEIVEPMVEPIVNRVVDEKMATKQDKLTPGNHVEITKSGDQTIINVTDFGDIPEDKTIVEFVEDKFNAVDEKIDEHILPLEEKTDELEANKQDKLIPGKNVTIRNNVIDCLASSELGETIVTTETVGGIKAGTEIDASETLAKILKDMLCPEVPPPPEDDKIICYGVSDSIPTNLDGLTEEEVDPDEIIACGFTHRYTANDQYFVFAFSQSFGELISIKDGSGFEQLDGWNRIEFVKNITPMYIYYTKESLTTTNFKVSFIWND